MMKDSEHPWGFRWGPVTVTRLATYRGRHILKVNNLEIYVSPTGRSVRVFKNGKELK